MCLIASLKGSPILKFTAEVEDLGLIWVSIYGRSSRRKKYEKKVKLTSALSKN